MKKRMSKKPQVEVQQLPPRDIQRREAVYRKHLGDLKNGLIAGERFKKNGIKKLAEDLEEARTIEVHKISARIKNDLKAMIDENLLTENYVSVSLDEKYKQAPRNTGGKNQYQAAKPKNRFEGGTATQTTTTDTTNQTTNTQTQTQTQPQGQSTEAPKPSPQSLKQEQEHDELVSDLYGHIIGLTQLITGYKQDKILSLNDNYALVSQTKQFRFDMIKKLYPLDLKTLYDFSKRLAIVLDDSLKQFENELDSRRKQPSE
jgi:hypothetical protein